MSGAAFQTALANLIRFPMESLDHILGRLESCPLSEREKNRLVVMADDPLVRKYAEKMRILRQRDATQIMRLSKPFIEKRALDTMYQDYFEPTRGACDLTQIGVIFLEYLLNTSKCMQLVKEGPPFLEDLLRYDYTKSLIERSVLIEEDPSLPEGSLLYHNAFSILKLGFDAPTLDKKVNDGSAESGTPPDAKSMTVIIMRSIEHPFVRVFEIDAEIENFILAQRNNPLSWTSPLPAVYSNMVGVGFCRARKGGTGNG